MKLNQSVDKLINAQSKLTENVEILAEFYANSNDIPAEEIMKLIEAIDKTTDLLNDFNETLGLGVKMINTVNNVKRIMKERYNKC